MSDSSWYYMFFAPVGGAARFGKASRKGHLLHLPLLICIGVLNAGVAQAAIEAVSMSASGGQNDKSSYSFAHTVNSSAGRLLVVGVSGIDSSEGDTPVNSVSFNGRGMTRIGNTLWKDTGSTSSNRISGTLFYQLNPDVGTYNVTVSHNGAMYGTYAWARSYKNVAAFYTSADNTSSGSNSASTNISVATPNSLVVDLCSIRGNTVSVSSSAGAFSNTWILRGGNGDQRYNPAGSEQLYGATGTANMTWSFGGTQRWVHRVAVFSPNVAPTNITLSGNTVNENAGAGTGVGNLAATDPESDACTYSLVGGDTGAFSLSGNTLLTAYPFNYEGQSSYTVTVRATDACGNIYDKGFTVYVANVNETPTGIGLAGTTVAENTADALVGTLNATDPDAGSTFSYAFVSNEDNAFTIAGNELRTSTALDYETKNSYSLRIRATDNGGLSTEADFTVTVLNVNEPPSGILLSNAVLSENSGADHYLGSLIATGDPEGDGMSFSLESGEGDTHNGSFRVDGSGLYTTANFDYETSGSPLSIRVRATDTGSPAQAFARAFSITLLDADEVPPNPPTVSGTASPTNLTTPQWTWDSGGGGGNGTFRIQLDSTTGGWTETSALSWTPSPLLEGSHRLYVQERDEAGNWSPSSFFDIFIDLTAPNPPAVTGPAETNDTTPEWTWTSNGGGDGHYRYQLDSDTGAWTDTTLEQMEAPAPLAEGSHRLYVQERDEAGNWSVGSFFDVFIDLTGPASPVLGGPATTNDSTPEWTWTPGGGGNGTYRYQLDSTTGTWTETTSPAYSPATPLSEGTYRLYVEERDAVGNWSADSFFDIFVDMTPPVPPAVTGPAVTNNTRPEWTWNPSGGGNGVYRWMLDGLGSWAETSLLSLTAATDLTEGSHTLAVQERDAAGNWSLSGTSTVAIDLTPPAVTVTSQITNDTTPAISGTATDDSGITAVVVTIDGQPCTVERAGGTWTARVLSPLAAGPHEVLAEATDTAGNTAADASTNEVVIDFNVPGVSVDLLVTNDTTPTITGTAVAHDGHVVTIVRVTVNGVLYTFTPGAAAQTVPWTITTDALGDAVYDVEVQAQDELSRIGTDGTTGELTVDTQAPQAEITRAAASPTGANSVAFTVTFDGDVGTTFDEEDVDTAGLPGLIDVTGAGAVYTVTVTFDEPDTDGLAGITIGTEISDLAGNPFAGAASPQYDIFNWRGFRMQPIAAKVYTGTAHTFTVVPDCDATTGIGYRWWFDNGLKSLQNGPLTPSWDLDAVGAAQAGTYWCEVSYDGLSYFTGHVLLEVANPLSIVESPADFVAVASASHTFTVTTDGGFPPLSYEWYKVGQAAPVGAGPEYTVDAVGAADIGFYFVQVSDLKGTVVQSQLAELSISSGMPVAGLTSLAGLAAAIAAAACACIRRKKQ